MRYSNLSNSFFKTYQYTQLISGSTNFSSGNIQITKKGKMVIVTIKLYLKNALSPAVHQLLSLQTLQDIGCSVDTTIMNNPETLSCSSDNHHISVSVDSVQYGLCIYPLSTLSIGENFRCQLVWFAE